MTSQTNGDKDDNNEDYALEGGMASPPDAAEPHATAVPVVGVGASAGGLTAFKELLSAFPADTGMAFVLIQHLAPQHESLMAELLAHDTEMTVTEATDGVTIDVDHVYVIPPKVTLLLEKGRIRLVAPVGPHASHKPIDAFFRSLAAELAERAIGIVLSGTGTDGTLGLKSIREVGGLAIAQDPLEAEHGGMPRSAYSANAADRVLTIAQMPAALHAFVTHAYFAGEGDRSVVGDRARSVLFEVISKLRQITSIDYSLYKEGTLLRRIERRMSFLHIADGAAYIDLLDRDPAELENLSRDLLIGVTSFFRDPSVFHFLETDVLPELVKSHPQDAAIRVWVPACATGEEAYSLAMLFIEQAKAQHKRIKLQVFATDVDEHALATAREGVFPDAIESDVSPERLETFFTKEDHTYSVKPELRETVVFAAHNALSDPPFSRIDLVSCRNFLIYVDPKVQGQVLSLFHYALSENGVLVLGPSETANAGESLFEALSKRHRVYRRVGVRRAKPLELPISSPLRGHDTTRSPQPIRQRTRASFTEVARAVLLEQHTPAAVLINRAGKGLFFSGPVDRYLKVPSGEPGQGLLAMVRNGFKVSLRTTIQQAFETKTPVRSEGAWLRRNGDRTLVTCQAEPISSEDSEHLLITFREISSAPEAVPLQESKKDTTLVTQLEKELETTQHELRMTIRDLEASNEELKAANEEAMSMNEEFQSTNEELETSKEELQSLNEELTTINNQLQQKINEQRQTADNLSNLLTSSQTATLFLDKRLAINWFAPASKALFNLIASDVGRLLSDITTRIDDEDLLDDAREVLTSLKPSGREVRAHNGRWYLRRILPYRADDKIDGVVLTFVDVTELKAETERADRAGRYARAIVETVREPLLVLAAGLKVETANPAFYNAFRTTSDETEGAFIYDLGNGQWDIEPLRVLLEKIVPENSVVEGFEVVHNFPAIGRRTMILNARRMVTNAHVDDRILLAIDDVTGERDALAALSDSEQRFRRIYEGSSVGIAITDAGGRFLQCNRAFCETIGYAEEELRERTLAEVLHEEDKGAHDASFERLARGELQQFELDTRYIHKDGRTVWVRKFVSAMPGTRGEPTDSFALVTNVTDQRQYEEALLRNRARLKGVFDTVKDGILITGDDGTIQNVNPAVCTLFGLSTDELIGSKASRLFDGDETARSLAERPFAPLDRELTCLRADGSTFPGHISVTGIPFDHDELYTFMVRDLTEAKRQQEMLRQAQKMEAMGQLTGGVAHDFNNLLTVIRGNLELAEIAKTNAAREKCFREALEAVELGANLTARLLAFGRRVDLRPQQVDLNTLLVDVGAMLERLLPENVEFTTKLDPDLSTVEMDPGQLQNAIINLAVNARDAMSTGGRLTVETTTVALTDADVAHVPDLEPGDYVALAVADTGRGMADAVREKVFEPFFTTKPAGEGSGLGLSMVYGFVKQSGGHVTIASEPGEGTTVTLYLPHEKGSDPARQESALPVDTSDSEGRGEVILVVEDDPQVRSVTARRLESLGFRVLEAKDASEALGLIEHDAAFDLLFTDIVMPGDMSGITLAKKARALRPGLRVLLTSGYSDEARERPAETPLLAKPYSLMELGQTLRGVLDGNPSD